MTTTLTRPGTRADLAHQVAVKVPNCAAQVKILIVDDQPSNLLVVEAVLVSLGHTLVRAHSGEEALKCLLQDDFAVILMDVLMPGMDGFETAEVIRRRERSRHTPIIFMTAIGTSEMQVTRGYSVGAVDYLFKPFIPEILRAKVAAFVDLFLKTATVAAQARQIREFEQQRHDLELAEARRRLEALKLEQDVRAARKVQQLLFPHTTPMCPGFDIAGASCPADATGGDYFDYIPNVDGFLDVVIGDVSGHGFAAALLMSATRAYLRALALARTGIDEIMTLTNRALASDMQGNHFVTLHYMRLSQHPLTLQYASAGHPNGYVMSSSGEVRETLRSTAIPLGITVDSEFPAGPQCTLESGDLVFLFTDGVTEALAPNGRPFGIERALNVLRQLRSRPAAEIVNELLDAVKDYVRDPTLQDDVTAIIVKVN